MTRTSHRKVLVSGASSGIGRAVSELLLQNGHYVVGLGRNFSKIRFDHENFSPVKVDLSRINTLSMQLAELAKQHQDIDAVVNCAGQGRFGSLEEFSMTQMIDLMNLNFLSHALICRQFIPLLKNRHYSNIVFIGSEAALAGTQKGSIYCASKFALRGFSQALRHECSGSGVHVSIINPGMVKTEFFDGLGFKPGKNSENYIEPADIAKFLLMILESRPGTVVDEVNLSPLKRVVCFKK